MLTRAATPSTLNSISLEWFSKAHHLLVNNQYNYPLKRRINIPKPGKVNLAGYRPLTINEARVKIIERVLINSL